jgi:2-phosphoglycolate phosphatase
MTGSTVPRQPGTAPLGEFGAYLFDLDGTLVDTAPDINVALNVTLTQAGFQPVDESLTRHWVGHGVRVLLEQALDHQNADRALVEPMREVFVQRYQRNLATLSRPYPHVVATLRALRGRGARLGVVTNKLTRFTLPLLDALDLARWLDCVVCGDTAAYPKPAADPALHAGRLLGVAMRDTLFVGDSGTDIACARAAGCAVVCVADGYNHGIDPEALGADRVIASFRELIPD